MADMTTNGEKPVEMYRRHRPTSFKGVLGQEEAVAALLAMDPVPHAIMLCGPTGSGKTTSARALRKRIKCNHNSDYVEINAALARGIDTIREIEDTMNMCPRGGVDASRLWVLDECHRLTSDAQAGLLNMLENAPRHAYFVFCTTAPAKVIPELRGRCKRVDFKVLSSDALKAIVQRSLTKEGREITDQVMDRIIETAKGSGREALVWLETALNFKEEKDQLEVIRPEAMFKKTMDLAKALLWQKAKWSEVAKIINSLSDEEDWERMRLAILTCACNELLKEGVAYNRAAKIVSIFRDNWFEHNLGKRGLIISCFEVLDGK